MSTINCLTSLSLHTSTWLYDVIIVQIYGAEFIETSAKTGYNVVTALLMLVRYVHKH